MKGYFGIQGRIFSYTTSKLSVSEINGVIGFVKNREILKAVRLD